jgi:hypothetical protein
MIAEMLADVKDKSFRDNSWGGRHVQAWRVALDSERHGLRPTSTAAVAVVRGVEALALYADAHAERFDSDISEDHVLGPAWRAWGDALLTLLNGETGALDCGTVDGLIRRMGACSEP